MISFFIQARSNSSRLKAKMLLPFWKKKSLLQLIIDRLINAFGSESIYILTTNNSQDDLLVESLKDYNINIFRGDEQNVLNRFVQAGKFYGKEDIIRVCADNPFLDIPSLKILTEDNSDLDYVSFSYNDTPVIKTHLGFFAEKTKISVLNKVASLTDSPMYLEHVTNYIYSNKNKFNIKLFPIDDKFNFNSKLRLTVDTKEDFQSSQIIFSQLADPINFSINDVLNVINQNPELIESMDVQIKLNSK